MSEARAFWSVKTGMLLAVLLVLMGGGAYYFWLIPEVIVTRLEQGQAVTAVYASGNVEPVVMLKLAPKLTGRLAELLVDEGDKVMAGQPLARLDDTELAANLTQLQARFEWAQKEASRAKALLARQSGTVQERDKAENTLRETQAAVAIAEKQRSEYTLVAPVAGIIIRRDGEAGEVITANQQVFTLAAATGTAPTPLRITTHVDEEDVPLVQVGQRVLIRADAFPDQSFEGRVESVTPKGDPTERNFRVRIGLPSDTPLHVGMTTEINIIIAVQDDALLLPASAVRDGKVWLVRDGRLVPMAVTSKPTNSGRIAVTAGVGKDDWVVVAPDEKFKAGMRCRAALPANQVH